MPVLFSPKKRAGRGEENRSGHELTDKECRATGEKAGGKKMN